MLAFAWGSAFTAIKLGLSFFPPVLFAALRYDIASVLLLAYAAYKTEYWVPRTRAEWGLVAIGGVFMIAAYHAFLFVGEQGTTSTAAAIVVSLSPLLTAGFSRLLLPNERLTRIGVVGLVIGFIGVGVLSKPDPSELLDVGTMSLFLVFLAVASFALGSVLTRRIDATLPVETQTGWAMLIGAVLMHLASLALGESLTTVTWSSKGIGALVYLVLVSSIIGFITYFDLLDQLGPIEINLVTYVAPLIAAGTGFLLLGETISTHTIGGFFLIFLGFTMLKRDHLRCEYTRLRLATRSGRNS